VSAIQPGIESILLTLNNFQCPTGLSELVLPKVLPFNWILQMILSAIWRYAYLYEYSEALKVRFELSHDVSPIDVLVHEGCHDFWPCTTLLPLGRTGLLRHEGDEAVRATPIPYSPVPMEDLSECSSVRSSFESSVAFDDKREDYDREIPRTRKRRSISGKDDSVEIDLEEIHMDGAQYRGSSAGGEDHAGPDWCNDPDSFRDSAGAEADKEPDEELER
ncbi:hypothetical protein Pmar_PMAR020746, partial [Perkinsus marinus ATCC 50983]